jgi:MraZ protein
VFVDYLAQLGEKKVFVTSLDLHSIRIYPISVWRENEKFFESYTKDPRAAEDILFLAYSYGADCELDGEGRLLLLPQELRKKLNAENQPVHLYCYKGRINVFTSEVHQERHSRATDGREDKLSKLEGDGLR